MQRGKCGSNPKDHCCWLPDNKQCPYLRTTDQRTRAEDGFYWKCSLRAKLGSWDAVHDSPQYLAHVKPHWEATGESDCGDYPDRPGGECKICGKKAPT